MDIKNGLLLSGDNGFEYRLFRISESECKDLQYQLHYNLKNKTVYPYIDDIHCIGEKSEINIKVAAIYIPLIKVHTIKPDYIYQRVVKIKEYQCYGNFIRNKYSNVIIHEDEESSLKCACNRMQAKYFMILKIKQKTDEPTTDTNRDT